MSILELQSTLHEHADAVVDSALAGRAGASRRRGQQIRRRRRAVTAAAAALVVAPFVAAAMLGANPLDGSNRDQDPVNRGDISERAVLGSFAGRELVDSDVVTGASEVVLEVPAGERTELHVACWGVGPKYTLKVLLDGNPDTSGEALCEKTKPEISQMAYGLNSADAEQAHTLRAWLEPNYPDLPEAPKGAYLLAAAYRLPDIVARVANQDVYELERSDGDDYRLATYDESRPGSRVLRSTFVAEDWVLPELFAYSGSVESPVTVVVDGVEKSDLWLAARGYRPEGVRYRGPHTIELRIRGDVPPDAVLGVLWRTIER